MSYSTTKERRRVLRREPEVAPVSWSVLGEAATAGETCNQPPPAVSFEFLHPLRVLRLLFESQSSQSVIAHQLLFESPSSAHRILASSTQCNQQEGGWECGYYVMCWMHEFVLSRQFDFPNSNWKDDGPYSDEQLERRTINELMTYNMEKKTTDGRVQLCSNTAVMLPTPLYSFMNSSPNHDMKSHKLGGTAGIIHVHGSLKFKTPTKVNATKVGSILLNPGKKGPDMVSDLGSGRMIEDAWL
ncbi:hypothetical protein LXL04_002596 [Taraxacum kok-saghyz]